MQRPSGRAPTQLRDINITRNFTRHAEGSVLVEFGDTRVICTASVEQGVPRFMRGRGRGWVTAEYGMLPRSTGTRMAREASQGKQGGRTVEIQRLIGRSLRAAVDLSRLGEYTINIDCDVIQADGGTRTAAITGACVALVDGINYLQRKKLLTQDPLLQMVASVSVGASVSRGASVSVGASVPAVVSSADESLSSSLPHAAPTRATAATTASRRRDVRMSPPQEFRSRAVRQ